MRSCGACSKPVRKYGPPVRHGCFMDQIVICTKCEWSGVETWIVEDDEPTQLSFMDPLGDLKIETADDEKQ